METQKIYVLVENSCTNYDEERNCIVGAYTSKEKAKEAFEEYISDETIQDFKNEWEYEGCEDEWTMPNESNLYFHIFNRGYSNGDYISIYVEECELK